MELRTGYDYHLADVVKTPNGYHAHCPACGWEGPQRDTKRAADDDAAAHDIAAND